MSATDNRQQRQLEVQVRPGQGPCTHPCGIAVSELVARELSLEAGDPVLVNGERETVAVVECVEPLNGSAAYLGRLVGANARAGQMVTLQRLEPERIAAAEKVVLSVDGDAGVSLHEARRDLNGLYLCPGDRMEVAGKGLVKVGALVGQVMPGVTVQICERTEVTVRKTFAAAGPVYEHVGN